MKMLCLIAYQRQSFLPVAFTAALFWIKKISSATSIYQNGNEIDFSIIKQSAGCPYEILQV